MAKQNLPITAVKRLQSDYLQIKKDPVPYLTAEPLPTNILEWHYVIYGVDDSPYKNGFYHGKLIFPKEFPFKPPSIYMITPNGRFKCNTRLCLSFSDYHPELWKPAWSVSSVLVGLVSFMMENTPTLGSEISSDAVKKELAIQSGSYNLKNDTFCSLFPAIVKKIKEGLSESCSSA